MYFSGFSKANVSANAAERKWGLGAVLLKDFFSMNSWIHPSLYNVHYLDQLRCSQAEVVPEPLTSFLGSFSYHPATNDSLILEFKCILEKAKAETTTFVVSSFSNFLIASVHSKMEPKQTQAKKEVWIIVFF